MGIDLESWRDAEGLTDEQVAERLGCSVNKARRLASGADAVTDEILDHVLDVTHGKVDAFALYQRRVSHLLSTRVLPVVPVLEVRAEEFGAPQQSRRVAEIFSR